MTTFDIWSRSRSRPKRCYGLIKMLNLNEVICQNRQKSIRGLINNHILNRKLPKSQFWTVFGLFLDQVLTKFGPILDPILDLFWTLKPMSF